MFLPIGPALEFEGRFAGQKALLAGSFLLVKAEHEIR